MHPVSRVVVESDNVYEFMLSNAAHCGRLVAIRRLDCEWALVPLVGVTL